jgi:MAPEG family
VKPEQRIVAIGASSGVLLMAAAVWALARALPTPEIADNLAARLGYAVRANVFATLPLVSMIAAVGNSRFLSDAIDPTKHVESRAMEIDGRVADNTLQQTLVFITGLLALSTVVSIHRLQIVWGCAIVFVIARMAFWIGYRLNPLFRATGMAATLYLTIGIIGYVLFRTITA